MTLPRRLAALLLLLLLPAACSTVSYTGRSRLIAVSEAEEVRLGEEAFREAVEEGIRVEDSRADLLRRVGAGIAAATGRPGYRWEFVLLESAEINAFALPGGKVVFYTGILPVCGDETGIAAVMAHEVAHVLARHGAERLSQAKLLEAGSTLLSAATAGSAPALRRGVLGAYGMGGKLGFLLPFSRAHETEADGIGLLLMARAGFDPEGALAFWRRLSAREEGGGGGILSTHPGGEERVRRIEELLPIAKEEYRKTAGGRATPPSGGSPEEIDGEELLRRLEETGREKGFRDGDTSP
ncbi:MAG: M48 family metallopeptidase [Deltaproteobacteria bacterium]